MVDRYDLEDSGMVPDADGDYVEWSDYEELLNAWNELNTELQRVLYDAPEF